MAMWLLSPSHSLADMHMDTDMDTQSINSYIWGFYNKKYNNFFSEVSKCFPSNRDTLMKLAGSGWLGLDLPKKKIQFYQKKIIFSLGKYYHKENMFVHAFTIILLGSWYLPRFMMIRKSVCCFSMLKIYEVIYYLLNLFRTLFEPDYLKTYVPNQRYISQSLLLFCSN